MFVTVGDGYSESESTRCVMFVTVGDGYSQSTLDVLCL